MKINTIDATSHIYARVAGLLYLIIIVSGISSEVFVRSTLIVAGDANATAGNILSSQSLFRIGFVADSIMVLADIAIAIVFYMLLQPVSKTLSLIAAVLRLTQAAVLGFNLLHYYAALLLLSGSLYTSHFNVEQLNSLVIRCGFDFFHFGDTVNLLGRRLTVTPWIFLMLNKRRSSCMH